MLILNDDTFTHQKAVKHSLSKQFRILNKEQEAFVEMVRYLQPTQQQLDQFQEDLVLCAAASLEDDELCWAFTQQTDTIIMTVSWVAAQRVNRIVSHKLFADKEPLSRVPCAAVAGQDFILPYKGMHIVINENRNKAACIVNGQDAKLISSNGNTILLEFPDGERAFVH